MKTTVITSLLILITTWSKAEFTAYSKLTQMDQTQVEFKVLFVGNSLTSANNLPRLVVNYAATQGITVTTKVIAKGGYAIVDHWAEGKVQNQINSKSYDFVVIQQGPSSQLDGYDMLVNDGAKYAQLCEENSAQLAYFMVWPSLNYYHTFDNVIKNHTDAASINNSILLPVGKVWKDYIDSTKDNEYYGSDGFHPSIKGSQVAAKVIVEHLLQQ